MIIDLNKTYKTRDGNLVRLYCLDGGGMYPVQGAVKLQDKWVMESWTLEGFYSDSDEEHCLDLIIVGSWDNLQVDDKVIVKVKKTGETYNCHFAGVSDEGVPKLYFGQKTSWTTNITLRSILIKKN